MAHTFKGARSEFSRLKPSSICMTCRAQLQRRHAATAAAPAPSHDASFPTPQPAQQSIPPVTATAPNTAWAVRAGVVLSRPPQITRDLTPFEKAFFLYQRRMNERTALPFHRYFYIPAETPQEVDWKRKIKTRKTAARDIGAWSAWDRDERFKDELLVGSTISEPSEQVERLLEDSIVVEEIREGDEVKKVEKRVVEKPMSRITEADKENDTKSLNRALARTLYLVVKDKNGSWQFPFTSLEGKESLARGAERLLVQAGGINMNTWMVGNAPVGHHTRKYKEPMRIEEQGPETLGEKIFFMKARMLAGSASLKDNPLGLVDHQWLAKDELQEIVHPAYFSDIKNMLPIL